MLPAMSDAPSIELIVRGVLLRGGRLLVCRNRRHGHRFLPGGHIEHGEPAAAALEREMREELGVGLRPGRFLGVCESAFRDPRPRHASRLTHEINLVFLLDDTTRSELVSREAKIEFLWMTRAELAAAGGLLPGRIDQLIPWAGRAGPVGLVTDWAYNH